MRRCYHALGDSILPSFPKILKTREIRDATVTREMRIEIEERARLFLSFFFSRFEGMDIFFSPFLCALKEAVFLSGICWLARKIQGKIYRFQDVKFTVRGGTRSLLTHRVYTRCSTSHECAVTLTTRKTRGAGGWKALEVNHPLVLLNVCTQYDVVL